jgi:hypothetical protein
VVVARAFPLADPAPPPGPFAGPDRDHYELVDLVEHDVVDDGPVDAQQLFP